MNRTKQTVGVLCALFLFAMLMWPTFAAGLNNFGFFLGENTIAQGADADRNLMLAMKDPGAVSTMTGTTSASSLRTIVGGAGHTAGAATGSAIFGGYQNAVDDGAHYALAVGNHARARHAGGLTLAGGSFTTAGDAQATRLVLRAQTTSATAVNMLSAGAELSVPTDASWAFWGLCTARRADTGTETGLYEIKGGVTRPPTGDAVLAGSWLIDELHEDSDWTVNISVTGSTLRITGAGEAGKTVDWVCHAMLSEVIG